jgi:hypothetical protein
MSEIIAPFIIMAVIGGAIAYRDYLERKESDAAFERMKAHLVAYYESRKQYEGWAIDLKTGKIVREMEK